MAQMKPCHALEVGHDPHDANSTSPYFLPFDLHRSAQKLLRVALSFVECEIKSQPLDFTNRIDGFEFITCVSS